MNRTELLSNYANDDDRILVSKLLDKIGFVEKKNTVENTDFLDIHQRSILEKVIKLKKYKDYVIYGGYDNSQRNLIIIYPEKLESVFENKQFDYNNILQVIRIILPNEMRGKYTHRDYLGAIIKVGIKREKVGDILVSLDGADIIVDKQIASYLKTSLQQLKRFSKSKIELHNIEELKVVPLKTQIIKIIIPSMRMDSIVSEIIRTSRSKALEIIEEERVFINNELITKNAKIVKENDLITVRGKGKFRVNQILSNTKRGNIVLQVEKYI